MEVEELPRMNVPELYVNPVVVRVNPSATITEGYKVEGDTVSIEVIYFDDCCGVSVTPSITSEGVEGKSYSDFDILIEGDGIYEMVDPTFLCYSLV